MSAETAFQNAVLARLAGDGAVQAMLGDPARAYDAAPGGAAFPYLVCGRSQSEPFDADEASLLDHRLTLHVWTRRGDREELNRVIGAARAALHGAELALEGGWRCVACRAVYADAFDGTDGRTLHGLIRLRALIEHDEGDG